MPRIPVLERGFPWVAALLAAACASMPRAGRETPVPAVRRGADRAAPSYAERYPEAKARLLARLNAERRAAGAPPVAYDLLAARVGDDFCLDTARTRSSGHWDTAGRPPYLRWGLAGGVDYHAENFGSLTRTGANVEEAEVPALLLDSHARMMAEVPPDDGHRRTVLDPEWTHVGIGAAAFGGEFRMAEEFSRHVVEWVEVPAEPLPAGARAPFAVKLPAGWVLASIEVGFEAPARPMSRAEIARRGVVRLSRRVAEPSRARARVQPVPGRLARRDRPRVGRGAGRHPAPLRCGQLLRLRLRGPGLGRGAHALAPHGGAHSGTTRKLNSRPK